MTEPNDALFEVPEDLRQEFQDIVSGEEPVTVEWLVELYRRGYNAKLGATGQHPYGKLSPSDQGELTARLALDKRNGVIRIEYGKPIEWLALPAAHARHLAKLLIEKANELDRSVS